LIERIPSLRGNIGRIVDLDLLSLFPQEYGRIMGGIERWETFPRSIMEGREGGENELKRVRGCWGRSPLK
jgi:hypothetical protein